MPRRSRASAPAPAEPEQLAAELRTLLKPEAPAPSAAEPSTVPATPEAAAGSRTEDIRLRDIDPRSPNVRRRMDPGELESLAASIRQHGVLEPIVVLALPKTRGYRYRLIAGFRRVAAARQVGLTWIPARVIEGPVPEEVIQTWQLTENLQREAMRVPDVVAAIDQLQETGLGLEAIAEKLGLSVSTVRLYRQLGEAMRKHKALAQAVERGLIGVAHFQAAASLLAKTRRRLAEGEADPAIREAALKRAEELFAAMLDRLASQKRLTVKAVTAEVSRLLALAGLGEPQQPAAPQAAPVRRLPPRAVLAQLKQLAVRDWSVQDLEELIQVAQAQVRAAKARLKELAGSEAGPASGSD